MNLLFSPTLYPAISEVRLRQLLVTGDIADPDIDRRISHLDRRFRDSAGSCPVPLWAPGLHFDREWRSISESYFPWDEIAPAFRRLISLSLRYHPSTDPLAPFASWPDFLHRFSTLAGTANPATLLQLLQKVEPLRRNWLFTLFLPQQHGGSFGRYPIQAEYLGRWLSDRRARAEERLACLDAACGTGEGTWDLAGHLRDAGFEPGEATICGSTLDPLELYSAAHASFPHDPDRERGYRSRVRPLVDAGCATGMTFLSDDLTGAAASPARYDLIICNGLLGGPLLHDPARIERVMAGMVRRLRPKGLILAADRFHDGWRKVVPKKRCETLLAQCGVRILQTGEGIGGELP